MQEPNEARRLENARRLSRRHILATAAAAVGAGWGRQLAAQGPGDPAPAASYAVPSMAPRESLPGRTQFQVGCFTFPYRRFPLQRCFEGIARAGFRYIGWGTTHVDEIGQKRPVLDPEADVREARNLAARCRAHGLEPHLMFSMILVEEPDAVRKLTHRLKQAQAAGVSQVITFGQNCGPNRALWVERLKQLGPIAADLGVLLVLKQHGTETGSGKACADIIRDVNHSHVKVNYDAGKVQQMLNIDPLPDLKSAASAVHSLCIRDHRYSPKDEDCGPGLGEIDHYQLLALTAGLGRTLPVCCETVLAPLLPLPARPEEVDVLAVRARIFLELVVAGLQVMPPQPQTAAGPSFGTN